MTCTDWRLHVLFKEGQGRQDIGILFGVSCGAHRSSGDECIGDIGLSDAASMVRVNESHYRTVPLQVSRDGHRVAYFSKKHLKFVAWDLPTAQTKAISPRLDPQSLDDLSGLEISPDGGFFAVAFHGARPRLLITEFATGKTTTLNGYCSTYGMSRKASWIAVSRECSEEDGTYTEDEGLVTILKRNGEVVSEWKGSEYASVLSPNGRTTVEIHSTPTEDTDEYVITRDAMTGRPIKKFKLRLLSEPSDAIGDCWLNDEEYVVKAEPPESGDGSFGYYRLNVRSGTSHRIRDFKLSLDGDVSMGTIFARD
ncbi:hypothetical protein DP939_01140 [Spongiactinospora rosea]|uniref:Uncharacterized protein n=1 Tax=Spongiactinospora rosea TaxID=2248750 RepID=A0A366M6Y6_9ACTN|nr:hypothetical protein DP939_01140 [Spongiactinospora rosea]